ncbi:hypothetical protein Tco_1021841 [Tanacetum coccineum]
MIHTGISYRGGSMLKWSIAGFRNSRAWGSPLESFILGNVLCLRDSNTNGFRWYRHKESRHGWGKRSSGTSKLKRLLLMTCVGLDLEVFSKAYEERLNEAHAAGSIPVDLSLELQIK